MNHLPLLTLLAGNGDPAGNAAGDPFIWIMLGLLVLFMVFTFRRGKKMRDKQQQAHAQATVGAEVVTAGGLVGTVVHRDEERQRLTLEFSSGNRADFLLGAVQQITEPAPSESGDSTDDDTSRPRD
ncbi:preprotein translocase subunit YajC [Nesterenkonia sp. NBAIMH1]|uniref:preprotein translocase subunit YajC n=1 Tax=Nesterenkonia sp. NBAIMH1 TaxID=2600320 RepID=UPI0011B72073|nr:preprotein translocase subunit YajC [Nesterenkonia sp. NBAIMH1]